ncbi:lipopolysaccharide biosynthesis protein [Amaricoccus macauensis]|uniref:lipopolysaccharide biosynthesis protein n=1 Tax=Amaricoccus macauensis TaxID=57001 RepID=UPI003C7E0F56
MAWFFLSRVAAALIALITLLVLTRLLAPEEFGRYNMIVASGTICQQLLFSWIISSITRFHSAEEFGGRVLSVSLGAIFAAVALILPVTIVGYLLIPAPMDGFFLLSAAFAISTALHEFVLAALRVEKMGRTFAVATLLRPVLATSLAAGLVLAGGSYGSAVWANVAGAMLAVSFGLPQVLKLASIARPSRSVLKSFFAFGQPLSFVRSASMLFAFSTQFILATLVNFAQVGFFSAALTLSQRSITMLMVTLGQTTAASIFEALEKEGEVRAADELRRHFEMLLLISAPLTAVMVFANDTVASIIFNDTFGPGVAPHLAILSLAAFVNGVQASYLAFSFSMNKETMKQLGLTVSIAAVHILVTYFATREYGAIGASWAILGVAILNAAIYTAYGAKMIRASQPLEPLLKVAAAIACGLPFLLLADRMNSSLNSLALICAAMVACGIALKMLGYESLDTALYGARKLLSRYSTKLAR